MKLAHPLPQQRSRAYDNDWPFQLLAAVQCSYESYQLDIFPQAHLIADNAADVLLYSSASH